MWHNDPNPEEEASDEITSLLSNNFTINSGGRTIIERRTESEMMSLCRRRNIAPTILKFDDGDVENELSFYDSQGSETTLESRPSSPLVMGKLLSPECSPKRFEITPNSIKVVNRNPSIDEVDNFRSTNVNKRENLFDFKFVEPVLKQSTKNVSQTSRKALFSDTPDLSVIKKLSSNNTPVKSLNTFHSLSSTDSMESIDENYADLFEMDAFEDNIEFPTNLKTLISGHIKSVKTNTTPEVKKPLVRRCLSMQEDNTINSGKKGIFEPKTPEFIKKIGSRYETPPSSFRENDRCFKRPEPPTSLSPFHIKRSKIEGVGKENDIPLSKLQNIQSFVSSGRSLLRKSMSMNDAQIMSALAKSSSESDLIGDFSKPFCLPLMEGRHRDLKSISCETLAKLIKGEFKESVESFKIIDCRYPYEYEGGHILGASNYYTQEQILEKLVNSKTELPTVQADGPKRHILVFHCEFSSERGPKLSRFLRNHDRLKNSSKYPALHYPEIYLLHGGYKEFFEKYSDLCEPMSYCPMLHPSFGAAYRQFRAKSKSWNGDASKLAFSALNRSNKSRSRLIL